MIRSIGGATIVSPVFPLIPAFSLGEGEALDRFRESAVNDLIQRNEPVSRLRRLSQGVQKET